MGIASRGRSLAIFRQHHLPLIKYCGFSGMADWLGKGGFRLSLRQESLRAVYSCDHKRNGKSIASREITPMISQRPRDASTRCIGDWLGTGRVDNREGVFRSFSEAREHARSLRIKGPGEWVNYSKSGRRPADIPSNPSLAYKDSGWAGFEDFLGTNARRHHADSASPNLSPCLVHLSI